MHGVLDEGALQGEATAEDIGRNPYLHPILEPAIDVGFIKQSSRPTQSLLSPNPFLSAL